VADRNDDTLARFWDTLGSGEAADPTGVDPAVAEGIRRFHAARDVPGPDPTFVASTLEDLMNAATASPSGVMGSSLIPNGRTARALWQGFMPALPASPSRRRWAVSQLALAALLLITLAGGYIVFRPDRQAAVPPPTGTPVTAPSPMTVTPLAEVTSRMMPTGQTFAGIFRADFKPGARIAVGPGGYASDGPTLYVVEQGRLTLHGVRPTDGQPVPVNRAAPSTPTTPREMVPFDADVELGPGDSLGLTGGSSAVLANTSGEDTILLLVNVQTYVNAGGAETDITWTEIASEIRPDSPPAAPATIALSRVELPPGGGFAATDIPGLELIGVEAGTISLSYDGVGSPVAPLLRSPGGSFGYGLSAKADWGDTVTNTSDTPASLLILTVMPA
jgi:hypothetical protein